MEPGRPVVGAGDQVPPPAAGVDLGGEGAGLDEADALDAPVEERVAQLVGDGGNGQDIEHPGVAFPASVRRGNRGPGTSGTAAAGE